MTRNTFRRLAAVVLLDAGIQGFGASDFAGPASARPMIDPTVFVLHGSGPFSRAIGTASVIRLSSDRFSLALVADHLPALSTLHVKVARHVYVAWLVDGNRPHGSTRWGAVRLMFNAASGNYLGQGSVTVRGITYMIVTAEPESQALRPIMPTLIVLTGVGRQP